MHPQLWADPPPRCSFARTMTETARVVFYRGECRAAEQIARTLFGKRLEPGDYAGLTGAPDNAVVEVGTLGRGLYLDMHEPVANSYRAVRLVCRIPAGVIVVNDGFHIHLSGAQRHGLGLSIFRRQLAHAKTLGTTGIVARAGRRIMENGYYTWPRFGFGGPLPQAIRTALPAHLHHAKDVLDLFESVEGRRWWQQFGTTISVRFDLTDGSRSWQVFERYLRERGGSF